MKIAGFFTTMLLCRWHGSYWSGPGVRHEELRCHDSILRCQCCPISQRHAKPLRSYFCSEGITPGSLHGHHACPSCLSSAHSFMSASYGNPDKSGIERPLMQIISSLQRWAHIAGWWTCAAWHLSDSIGTVGLRNAHLCMLVCMQLQ